MSVVQLSTFRSLAASLGISTDEMARLNEATHPAALAFYIELRRSLAREYSDRRPFYLPANTLAAREFLPGRRDRKYYLALTWELLDLGLIVRIAPAANGDPAQYAFWKRRPTSTVAEVISFAGHKRNREVAHA